jgi:hypothetical protein
MVQSMRSIICVSLSLMDCNRRTTQKINTVQLKILFIYASYDHIFLSSRDDGHMHGIIDQERKVDGARCKIAQILKKFL